MASKRIVRFKCPYCDERYIKSDLVIHVGEVHPDYIPEGYTPLRVVFDYINKKPENYNGKCTECGGPTGWDENKGRYNRQCSNPKCHASYVKKFEKNMKDKLGVERISSTVEGQEKMLANRKISGKYKFQDGVEKTYTGKYEKATLEFLDKVMNCSSADVITPGPVIEYTYKKQKHFYISDIYYQPYNLVIEVKDGGDNPNNRDMKEYREKQIEKERAIIKNTDYNYIRLTNNDLSQLMSVFAELKMELVDNTNDRVIDINESTKEDNTLSEAMNALLGGYMPGLKDTQSVYIVNYLQNNVFSGKEEMNYAISDNIGLTNLICRNREGILKKAPRGFLENCKYTVYKVPNTTVEEVSKKIAPYMDQFVSYEFLYETVTGKKMYEDAQILYDPDLKECVSPREYIGLKAELMENLIDPHLEDVTTGADIHSIMVENGNGVSILGTLLSKNSYQLSGGYEYPHLWLERSHNDNIDAIRYVFDSIIKGGNK